MTVLAIDIGGTKMAAAVVDDDGNVLRRDRTPTVPADPWPTFVAMLDELVADEQVDGVGIGCGGPMTWPSGEVSPLNIPGWRDFPLRARLAERYPGVPVRLHNDAVAVAIAEHWRGAAQGVDNMIGMVVSTGVGGGIVSGGRILDGATGNAGHIGHVVADPAGPMCACGARGCLEAIARGPATVAWAREQGSEAMDGPALARLAADGDEVAMAAFARSGEAVGRVIAWCAALLDLEMVVVGGGLAQAGPPLWEPMLAAVREQAVLPFLTELRVVAPGLGGDAGLVGAAALVLAGERYWSAD
ncbi:MAG: ROK family protein [Frankiaceae bacterium]|nr:ROK family protein [Frankiaceae bacterium]